MVSRPDSAAQTQSKKDWGSKGELASLGRRVGGPGKVEVREREEDGEWFVRKTEGGVGFYKGGVKV
jgi:hypothetical protein